MLAVITCPKALQAFINYILPRLGEIEIKLIIYSPFIQNEVLPQVSS